MRSVSFLKRSVMIFPFTLEHDVSRNGTDVTWGQSHSSPGCLDAVCSIVNFRVGCRVFNSVKNSCSFAAVPLHTSLQSSRNLLKNCSALLPIVWYFSARARIFGSIYCLVIHYNHFHTENQKLTTKSERDDLGPSVWPSS